MKIFFQDVCSLSDKELPFWTRRVGESIVGFDGRDHRVDTVAITVDGVPRWRW